MLTVFRLKTDKYLHVYGYRNISTVADFYEVKDMENDVLSNGNSSVDLEKTAYTNDKNREMTNIQPAQNVGMNMPQMDRGRTPMMQSNGNTGMPMTDPTVQKSKLVVLLLAVFVGGWGIHNFYIGENEKGVTKIIITFVCNILLFITGLILPILNFVFLIPIVGVEIWALVEGINVITGQVKTDAKGIPFKD